MIKLRRTKCSLGWTGHALMRFLKNDCVIKKYKKRRKKRFISKFNSLLKEKNPLGIPF